MFRPGTGRFAILPLFPLLFIIVGACASGIPGSGGLGAPPSSQGTHTVLGRAFFDGGSMLLVEAHVLDGRASGTAEYSQVKDGGDTTFRVRLDVGCVGVFHDASVAVVTGPITETYGDERGVVSVRDWWVIQVEEGGEEGDRVLSGQETRSRALSLCSRGPNRGATMRVVEGDLAILSGEYLPR